MSILLLLCLGVAAAVVIPVSLRKPDWAVFALVFVIALFANSVLANQFSFGLANDLLLGAALGLCLAYRLLYGETLRGYVPLALALLIWLVATGISLVFAEGAAVSLDPYANVLPPLIIVLAICVLIQDRGRLVHAFAALAAAAFLLSTLTVVQYALGLQSNNFLGFARGEVEHIAGGVDAFRPTGPLGDPNYYAQLLLPGLAISLDAAFRSETPTGRILSSVAAAMIGAAILLTASRGGMMALAFVLGLVLVREGRLISVSLMAAVPLAAAVILVPSYNERLLVTFESLKALATGSYVAEASISGRVAEMQAAAELFRERPLTGYGFGQYEAHYQEISLRAELKVRPADRSAHSLYLETAAEQGIIGLAAMATLLGMAGAAVLRAARSLAQQGDVRAASLVQAFALGAAGYFAAAIFLHDAFPQYIWLILGLCFVAERVSRFSGPIRGPASSKEPRDDLSLATH